MELHALVDRVNGWVWGMPLVLLCLGTGVLFSLWTRFLQVRHLKAMVKQLWQGQASASGISSFQGFAMALGGRVGTGNIAGVATAIAMGGPGALFWMWAIAFLGAGSAFIEAALAQVWKEKVDGEYRGGPSYYIERGLGMRWYGILFAAVTVLSCGLLLPGIQSNSIAAACQSAMGIPPWASGVVIIVGLGLIIFGGVKRIGKVAELAVPFMAVGYMLMAVAIVVIDYRRVPEVLGLVFRSAFGMDAAFGGIVGSAIAWGVKRGIFSNEAGQGTGPQAAAAAEVAHPAQQGLVQAFSVFPSAVLLGAPSGPTRVISIAAYQAAFEEYDYSMASAVAMIMGVVQLSIVVAVLAARGNQPPADQSTVWPGPASADPPVISVAAGHHALRTRSWGAAVSLSRRRARQVANASDMMSTPTPVAR